MNQDRALRISRCMRKMEEAQANLPAEQRMGRAEMMKAAELMDDSGAISEEGEVLEGPVPPGGMPKAGLLVLEVDDSEAGEDEAEGEGEPESEMETEDDSDMPSGGGGFDPDILFELHTKGAIEIKDPQLLEAMGLRKEIEEKASALEKDLSKISEFSQGLAKRLFS